MRYLDALYSRLLSRATGRYSIRRATEISNVDEYVRIAYDNVRSFKQISLMEQRKLVVDKNSFIITDGSAFCAFRLLREYGQRRFYVYEYHVMPEQERRGLGQQLLNEIIILCKELGIKHIALTVDRENEAGVKFWNKNGFKRAKESPDGESYEILVKVVGE